MSVHQGLDRSSRMTPIVRVRRSARLRATGSGRYPSSATALSTACRFSSLTRGEFCSTSDTNDLDTPALAATVRIVGGLPIEGSLAMLDPRTGHHAHVELIAHHQPLRRVQTNNIPDMMSMTVRTSRS